MQYPVRYNYIEDIQIYKMPYTNFYDNGKTLRIQPSLTVDADATFSYKNDVADINKIRFSKRLRHIYDIKGSIQLTEKNGAYETEIRHSLLDYNSIQLIPTAMKQISNAIRIGEVNLLPSLHFEFPEHLYGTYKVSIYTKKKKCIKLEPIVQVKSYPVFTVKELYSEYGIDLAWYPYDEVTFLCETTSQIRLNAAMLQKLDWSVKRSKLSMYRGKKVDNRFIYYIGEDLCDFLSAEKCNSFITELKTGYITEDTVSYKRKMQNTIQLLQQTKVMTENVKEMKKEYEKLIQEQRETIERLKKHGTKI